MGYVLARFDIEINEIFNKVESIRSGNLRFLCTRDQHRGSGLGILFYLATGKVFEWIVIIVDGVFSISFLEILDFRKQLVKVWLSISSHAFLSKHTLFSLSMNI